MQGENVVWIFNRKLECYFPCVQISSAALWFTTSAAYSVSHPTTWHLCSYRDNFLTFWMWRLFASGKMSLSHQEGFSHQIILWGRWNQSPPNNRHRNTDWYQGRALHAHTEFWKHSRHKIMHFFNTHGVLKTHNSAVINSKELNQLLLNIQTKPTQNFLATYAAVFFYRKSQ